MESVSIADSRLDVSDVLDEQHQRECFQLLQEEMLLQTHQAHLNWLKQAPSLHSVQR
jgi:hypothetical protein